MRARLAAALLPLLIAAPLSAQTAAPAPVAAAPKAPPKLIVAISVDQFSADLFAQYRQRFSGGFARLLQGVVFPTGYQSHAATETCPGHSTILTGMRPAHTGIIANTWVNHKAGRPDTMVYCAEDERVPGSNHDSYTASDIHLRVPTLGERMKAANPAARVVSVAGKDRAAIMMGGHKVDQLWFWDGKAFVSYAGRPTPATLERANTQVAALIAKPQGALPLPGWCAPLDRPIQAGSVTVGAGRFARAAGDAKAFRASPALDTAVLGIAFGLAQEMKLGMGPTIDMLAIGLSATDYIGHANGNEGAEMCIQMNELDLALGAFFDALDGLGVDYEVVLTADHGAHDMTARQQQRAMPMEQRVDPAISAKAIGAQVGAKLGLSGAVLIAPEGDVYVSPDVPAAKKPAVIAEAVKLYKAQPQVAAVLTAKEIAATPMPTSPPETWTLAERARASHDPERSGDFLVMLKPRVTGIPVPGPGYVATHGSPWDYDRRVPILFWRKGMSGFEQPLSVETVDIAPTLAATIGLAVSGLDGRCLDLDAGAGDSCAGR
jgi:predicted AlkP superfamily pyrophosphatase or phosphodiesterase